MKRRKRKPLYPEPGSWIADQVDDLPPIEPPPPLPKNRLLSAGEIRDDYVAYEGLGFCIYNYISAQKIKDEDLRILWKKARRAMQAVVEYLETVPAPPDSLPAPKRRRRIKKKKKKTVRNRVVSSVESLNLEDLGEEVSDD